MVASWRETRRDPFLLAEGLLQLAGVGRPTRKQLGAAATVGEFVCKVISFLSPKE